MISQKFENDYSIWKSIKSGTWYAIDKSYTKAIINRADILIEAYSVIDVCERIMDVENTEIVQPNDLIYPLQV